jgi:transcription initiation factor TFIID subunit 6
MSFITPGTVQAIAHSLDIPQLSDDAAKALAPDVEYRLREVIQVQSIGVALVAVGRLHSAA